MTDETADLSLAPVSDLGRSLFASVEYTRARAYTYIDTHIRVHATEAAGAFSLSLLQTHVHPSRTTPLVPCRTLGSSSSSFLQTVGLKRFDTVFDGCFNRSFKQSL